MEQAPDHRQRVDSIDYFKIRIVKNDLSCELNAAGVINRTLRSRAAVMQRNDASACEQRPPSSPVRLQTLIAVIPVNENEIERFCPGQRTSGITAGLANPLDPAVGSLRDFLARDHSLRAEP